jgi:hypothetical protein
MKQSLKDRLQQFSALPKSMQGREKGSTDDLLDKPVTINDYGFMKDGDDEYAAFTIAEDDATFFFAGLVLTKQLKQLDEEGYGQDIRKDGIKILLATRSNKKEGKEKRDYTNVTYLD